ncbi:hypothetical protein [Sulfurovum sp.]|uniref:hypothetical protein n=1 Tax=Sulfurovum sp. TaxID=1969726 RepID=UPI0025EE054D|nr:hypothetical protein [Sulfurovum sp.]
MKKILVNLLTFLIVVAIIVILFLALGSEEGARYVYKGNTAHQAVQIKPKEYQCSECNMDVEKLEYAAQIITENGDTYFFDDIGCVVLWLENHKPDIVKILTQTLDTHHWIDVKKAWYTRISHDPMGYGFAALEVKKEGLIPYEEMKILMLQGKNLHDPFVKKKLLGIQ